MRERDWRREDLKATGSEGHGVVGVADLAELGMQRSTVSAWAKRDELVRLAPRAYLVRSLLDDRSVLAAALRSMPESVASHRCAAWLLGLDGAGEERIELTVPHRCRPRDRRWTVHRSTDLLPFEVVEIDGLRCTDATRTLCDLGAVIDDVTLERALECALRQGLTSLPRLRWRAGALARQGRSGPGALRRVLARRPTGAPPTESELETRFVQLLRAAGLPRPGPPAPGPPAGHVTCARRPRLPRAAPGRRAGG